eukprot:COSAG02_NODE_83_length_39665_cov_25.213719_10_plen_87_part_00
MGVVVYVERDCREERHRVHVDHEREAVPLDERQPFTHRLDTLAESAQVVGVTGVGETMGIRRDVGKPPHQPVAGGHDDEVVQVFRR